MKVTGMKVTGGGGGGEGGNLKRKKAGGFFPSFFFSFCETMLDCGKQRTDPRME